MVEGEDGEIWIILVLQSGVGYPARLDEDDALGEFDGYRTKSISSARRIN